MSESTIEAPARKPFAAWLQEHRKGSLHAELTEALAEVAAAVLEHGKNGTIALTIKVGKNKDDITLTVVDDLVVKAPKPGRGASVYFTDDAGNLSRTNPAQPELPLRGLPAAGEERQVPVEAAG